MCRSRQTLQQTNSRIAKKNSNTCSLINMDGTGSETVLVCWKDGSSISSRLAYKGGSSEIREGFLVLDLTSNEGSDTILRLASASIFLIRSFTLEFRLLKSIIKFLTKYIKTIKTMNFLFDKEDRRNILI